MTPLKALWDEMKAVIAGIIIISFLTVMTATALYFVGSYVWWLFGINAR